MGLKLRERLRFRFLLLIALVELSWMVLEGGTAGSAIDELAARGYKDRLEAKLKLTVIKNLL